MSCLYENFIHASFGKDETLRQLDFTYAENFNFAFDVVDVLAKKIPHKTALLWVSDDLRERSFTFADISSYSSMAANYFKSRGIVKGDKVMLILKRHYQFWFCMIALHKIGAVAIPATHQLMKKDIVYRCNAAGVKAIVCTGDGDIAAHIDEAAPESPTVVLKCLANSSAPREGWDDFDAGMAGQRDMFERPSGDAAVFAADTSLMYFTSGTTGYPKIACHSFTYPLGHICTARFWQNVNPDGIHFTISDTGWGKALWGKLYGQWLCETCVFVYDFEKFHADRLLAMFSAHQITSFCAPPTIYRFLIKEDLSKYDLSSLEHATIAGEALNPEVFHQFKNATGLKLMEGFGQTETTLLIGNLTGMNPKPGSMGKPNPQYDIRIVGDTGAQVSAGEVGEICVKTDERIPVGLYQGYYQDPERTNEAWHNGLYHSGDMAWKDEEGYFWYVGRTDDLIKSSGYRIGPFEIESVIMELPFVLECAVTGVPDPVRGQLVKASVVLVKGIQASDELKTQIQTYVKEHTAPYKYPRIVEFKQELPKTISGKIRRTELRGENT